MVQILLLLVAAREREKDPPPLNKISVKAAGRVYEYWHVGERASLSGWRAQRPSANISLVLRQASNAQPLSESEA